MALNRTSTLHYGSTASPRQPDGVISTAVVNRHRDDVTQSSTAKMIHAVADVTDAITSSSMGDDIDAASDSSGSSAVGIAIGVSVTCAVVLIVITALIYLLVKRKQRRRREKNIVRVENPQYKVPEDEHHLTLAAASTLSTAPTVKFTANNNASLLNPSNGRKKKEDAPLPPIYRPPSADSGKTKEAKRAAPQPPQTMNLELYEKDSSGGSAEDLTTITNATASPVDDIAPGVEPTSHSEPLIRPPSDGDHKHRPLSQNRTSAKTTSSYAGQGQGQGQGDDDIGCSDDLIGSDAKTALLGQNLSTSKMSLDSYDKTLNPFFT